MTTLRLRSRTAGAVPAGRTTAARLCLGIVAALLVGSLVAPARGQSASTATKPPKPAPSTSAAAAGAESRGPIAARVFTVKFRDPGDVALLVGQQLSDRGSVTTVPKLRTVTVQDQRDTLDRIAELIASYDVPPRSVQFTVTLILASRAEEPSGSISREVRGITEALPDISRWTDYKTLDSVTISGSEGSRTSREVAGEYRIEFALESVSEARGIIRLNPFSLMKAEKAADGAATYRPVYTTTVNLKNDKLLTIGATRSETSPRALFLAIRGHVEEP